MLRKLLVLLSQIPIGDFEMSKPKIQSPLPPFIATVRRSLSPFRSSIRKDVSKYNSSGRRRSISSNPQRNSLLPRIQQNQKTVLPSSVSRSPSISSRRGRPRTRLGRTKPVKQRSTDKTTLPSATLNKETKNHEPINQHNTLGFQHAIWVHRFIYKTKQNSAETRRLKEMGIEKADNKQGNKITTQSTDGKFNSILKHEAANWNSLRSKLISAKISEVFTNEKFDINGNRFTGLKCLGEGGYSRVLEVFNKDRELFALKVVNLLTLSKHAQKDVEKEIEFLEKLKDSKHVIEIIDHARVVTETKNDLLILMERGECDLSTVLKTLTNEEQLTPTKLRFYWEQMLEAVQSVHRKNIVHADLKPSNFVLVRGHLKVIDFGLAGEVDGDDEVLTRNFIGGTREYMSPESMSVFVIEDGAFDLSAMRKSEFILKVGYKSDIWALGIILYQLVYNGITPFSSLPGGKMAKLKALLTPDIPVDFEPVKDPFLMDTMKMCLQKTPTKRATLEQLLKHPFLSPTNI